MTSTARAIALATILTAAGGFLIYTSTLTARRDTIAFWAAGHLLLGHKNPYDNAAVLQLERTAGYIEPAPQMVRNPPFALWIALPLGLLSLSAAGAAWTLMTVAALFASVQLMRRMFPTPNQRPLLLAYLFGPAIACVQLGQYGTVVTLGIVCFLRWHATRPFRAGLALLLVALKPHLVLPFLAVLACWIVSAQAYRVFAGALVALVFPSALVTWLDPNIWRDYLPMLSTANQDAPLVPTFASLIGGTFGWHVAWLPYVATLVGCVWGIWYFTSRRTQWEWTSHGPMVMVVSMWVAPYAWMSDQMIVLPAVLETLIRRRRSLATFVALNAATLIPLFAGVDSMSPAYGWMPTAWLVWYAVWLRGPAKAGRHD